MDEYNIEGYSFMAPLGEGTYGKVLIAVDSEVQKLVAVKVIAHVDDNGLTCKNISRELLLLSSLCHKNIISFVDLKIIKDEVFIIMEYMYYDLHVISYDNSKRDILMKADTAFVTILFQILNAVNFIHVSGVIHRDIKPANILINSNLHVKICDFGIARLEADNEGEKEPLTEYMVTRWYRAPELVLSPGQYGKAQDLWAVGCTLSEIICRAPLFPGRDTVHQLCVIIEVMGTPTEREMDFEMPPNSRRFVEGLSSDGSGLQAMLEQARAIDPDLSDILTALLQFNPSLRVTAEGAISHQIFSKHRSESTVEPPVPSSWGLYHEAMSRVGEAKTKRARLRAIRSVVSAIQEDLKSRILQSSVCCEAAREGPASNRVLDDRQSCHEGGRSSHESAQAPPIMMSKSRNLPPLISTLIHSPIESMPRAYPLASTVFEQGRPNSSLASSRKSIALSNEDQKSGVHTDQHARRSKLPPIKYHSTFPSSPTLSANLHGVILSKSLNKSAANVRIESELESKPQSIHSGSMNSNNPYGIRKPK